MSAEQSRAEFDRLYRDVKSDPALQEEFQAVTGDRDAWFELAHEKGYQISREDLDAMAPETIGELSDADLEAVAGGWSLGCDTNTVNPTFGCPPSVSY